MKTVLIVDDSSLIRFHIKQTLQPMGLQLIERDSGDHLLKLLKYNKFKVDLIILDIQMPGLDGLETIHEIKQLEQYRYTPIIIMTSFADPNTVAKALSSGIQDFIVKPFKEDILRQKITKILGLNIATNNTVNFSTEKYIDIEIKRTYRGKTCLSLVAIAVTEMKYINLDNEILSGLILDLLDKLSAELKQQLRETDIILLYQNDKLLIVLPLTDKDGLQVIRKKIEEICLDTIAEEAKFLIDTVTFDGKVDKPYNILEKFTS